MFVFITVSGIQLEDGSGVVLMETGDVVLQESSAAEGAVSVFDENPVLAVLYYHWQASFFFQMEPSDQVNPAYLEAWQNQSTQLMPEYTSEYLHGDIHNYPAFFMQLSTPVFSPDGTGVKEPGKAPLLNEGSGSVDIVGPA